ncbi:endonuclease/exonuclease/phosphatase family protein [Tasmannia lanceolata]|uniref:endonuclease/exonuclease/phosphatase family protein n=1 Tax=Tasmannia lanceolata TaxID=3420 RepID=UPI004064983A
MRIVTYNVNGLRARVSQYGSLLNLLNALQADIICIQETKLSRPDLSADLTMAAGYEAFFSCTRTLNKGRVCYSGVATFCHVNSAFSSNEVALPLAAEEGFTGLLEHSRNGDAMSREFPLKMPIEVEGLEEITKEDLLKVDSEGRCIITDHGHFVLFNLYGPRADADDKERVQFKLMFFKILQKRWESLISQGRRVFVVGDLNIAPAAIDRCEAGPDFEENMFRKWLRSLLTECGGPFFDVFRSKHPQRKEAYTCWPQQTGAEEFNYGSRIDHILIAGPCLHQNHDVEGHNILNCNVKECDILDQFKRWKPGSISRWKGGRSSKLEGSDHVPVYVCLTEVPNLPVHNVPYLAARYVPEIRGFQQTIVSLLLKRQDVATENYRENVAFGTTSEHNMVTCASQIPADKKIPNSNLESQVMATSIVEHLGNGVAEIVEENTMIDFRCDGKKSISRGCVTKKKSARHGNCSQLTLRSFFQKDKPSSSANIVNANNDFSRKGNFESSYVVEETNSPNNAVMDDGEENSCQKNKLNVNLFGLDQGDVRECCSSQTDKTNDSLLEWRRIQQLMHNSVPLCKGHGEACVARSVKKSGPNLGRGFYTCARPEGPSSNPETNCGHFQWSSSKYRKKQR